MNWAKINTFLLIVVIIGIGVALYFLFTNKKDNARQNDALAVILKSIYGEEIPAKEEKVEKKKEELPAEPTEKDWEQIYAISEKIYFKKPRTEFEKKFQKRFDTYINADVEYCNEFYPIIDKMIADTELNAIENEFYKVNKEDVDKEVYFRNLKAVTKKLSSKEELNEKEKEFYEANKEKISTKLSLYIENNNNEVSQLTELAKSNPPLAVEERNKQILSFFEDGIPKTVPQISELFKSATGHDYAKNIYRVLGSLEGKFLTPYKHGKITYYCLPEWFDGRKLKPEFKNAI